MNIEQVVRVVEVRGQVSGMDQVARAYDQVADASAEAAAGATKVSKAQSDVDKALAATLRQLQLTLSSQQQFSDQMRQQAQIASQIKAANDNSAESFSLMGVEIASAANHLRQAAEAAYAFSPAFRGVVNEMARPALGFAATALAATATGLVTATNVAGRGLIELGLAAARSSSALTPLGANIALLGARMAEFSPVAAEVAGTIAGALLSAVLRIAGPILLLKDAVDLLREAWRLGGEELDRYRKIAEDAAKVDLSTTFFQKLTKGAEDARLPIEDVTRALQNLQKASADALGGSALQQRLNKHLEAGNFDGNAGVAAFGAANTSEEKLRAVAQIIREAMEDGQRLAAIDLANTAFGPEVADHLRTQSDYLDRMLEAADKVKDTRLVSDADVGNALALQQRYDAAVAILEQRWHPIQALLTDLGIKMREIWVGIVEAIAKAADAVVGIAVTIGDMLAKAYGYVVKILDAVPDWAKTGAKASASLVAGAVAGPVAGAAAGAATGLYGGNGEAAKGADAYSSAVDRLRAGLQNQAAVQQSVNQATTIANKVYGDTSKTLDAVKAATQGSNDAVDRAINSLQRHIQQQLADAQAVGLGDAALARFRVEAAQTAAMQANGGKITAEQAAAFEQLKIDAYNAADALAKAKVASQIEFGRKTAFLSAEDVQIARQLAGIYGNDVPKALASTEAAQLRMINLQKDMKDSAVEFAKTFAQGLMQGKSAMDALVGSLDQLSSKLMNSGIENLLSFNPAQMGMGALQVGASALISMFTGDQKAKKALEEAQDAWKKMADQVTNFKHAADGVDLGPLTQKLQSLFSTMTQLTEAAAKAKEWGAVAELQRKYNEAVVRSVDEFVNGANVLTDLQKKIKAINDEAIGLTDAAPDRAAMIEAGRLAQIAKATADFVKSTVDGLQADLNAAAGRGYLTELAADIQKYNDLLSQGIDKDLLSRWLQSQAQKIVNDAGLAGYALQGFNAILATTGIVVSDAASAIAQAFTDSQAAVASAQSAVTSAQNNLNQAYQAGAQVLQTAIDKQNAFATAFRRFINSLSINPQYSPLSAQAQYQAARVQLDEDSQKALAGDAEAQSHLQDDITTFLDQSKSFNASTLAYYEDFQYAQQIAQSQLGASARQVSVAQQQLDAMNQQVSGLITINTGLSTINGSVLAVAQAINSLQGALGSLAAAQATQTTAASNVVQTVVSGGGSGIKASDQVAALYSGVLHRDPDASGAAYWQAQINSGLSGRNLVKAFTYAAGLNAETYIDPAVKSILGLAGGGMVGNGMWGRDSVVASYAGGGNIALAGGEYVMPAMQTARYAPILDAMRAGSYRPGNDNDMLAELRALRQEVAALRAATTAGASHVREGVDKVGAGLGRQSADQRQANNRPAPYGSARKAG